MDQQLAAAQKAAEATTVALQKSGSPPSSVSGCSQSVPDHSPAKTAEEAEKLVREKQEEIRYQQELIDKTEAEDRDAVDEFQKQALDKKLEMLRTDLHAAQAELKELEAGLAKLKPEVPASSQSSQAPRETP